MQKSLTKNALFNFIKSCMNIIFPIISFPYASRILMPEGIGKVNFANSIVEYFLMLAELGITVYAAREAAKIRDDKARLTKFAREILSINLISTALSYVLLLFALFSVDKFAEYRVLLIICSTKVLFTTAGISWLFRAMEDYGYITARSIAFQVLSLIFLFLFVRDAGDYYQYAAMGVFSNVGSNIFNFFYARRYINVFAKTRVELKKHLKPIFVFFAINCAGKINSVIDAVMLGFLMGDVAVGFYSAAAKLSRFVVELVTSVVSSFMPRTSYYLENNMYDEYKKIIGKVFGATVFFALPAAAGLFVLCEPLILIFSGERYLPAVPSMRVLSIGIVGTCMNSFLNNVIITPQRKEKFSLAAQIAGVIFNVTFNVVLIKKYGVFGAALATMIVEFLLPAVGLLPSFKFLKSIENLSSIFQAALGTVVMFLAVLFVSSKVESAFPKIVVSVFTGAFVYAAFELLVQNKTALLFIEIVSSKVKRRR